MSCTCMCTGTLVKQNKNRQTDKQTIAAQAFTFVAGSIRTAARRPPPRPRRPTSIADKGCFFLLLLPRHLPQQCNRGETCWKTRKQWALSILPWPWWWWWRGHLLSSSRETGSIFLAHLFGDHPDPSIFSPKADLTPAELICRNRCTPIVRRGSTPDVVWVPHRPRC